MMTKKRLPVLLLFILLLSVAPPAQAQGGADQCPATVTTALDTATTACDALDRNETCYGHPLVSAEPRPEALSFRFEQAGHIVNVTDLAALQLGGMDDTAGEWGVALMRLQLDLPDTLPGQNVTLVLFGDVTLTPAPADDIAPMQAFYFATGFGDPPCAEVPPSGLLIQTPELAEGETVSLTINDVRVELGSTAFVQAAPEATLDIALLEGHAQVSTDGGSQLTPAGTVVHVPLDDELHADGEPSAPEPYPEDDLIALPLDLLPRPVDLPPAPAEDEIEALIAGTASGPFVTGFWTLSSAVGAFACEGVSQTMDMTAQMGRETVELLLLNEGEITNLHISRDNGEELILTDNGDGTFSGVIMDEGVALNLLLERTAPGEIAIYETLTEDGCDVLITLLFNRNADEAEAE